MIIMIGYFLLALIMALIITGTIRLLYYYFFKYLLFKKILKKEKKAKFNYKEIFKETKLENVWIKYKQIRLKMKVKK